MNYYDRELERQHERFLEPDEPKPLCKCESCGEPLYEGDAVLEWWQEGEVFCDEKCLLEYAGATPVILGY